ncbi:MAG TPA: succinate--CoA ligase subunit alpha [Candidatus Nitrosocosmicus sp.]|nr:succinate--CoA ligase subunit alpha [Candidatus Nitrosocosmicus sp.]
MNNSYNIFSILVGNNSDVDYEKKPVIIQGITGSFGSKHANLMRSYGTNIAAGVTPGKGGSKFEDVPIYNTMKEAVEATGSVISGVFVPAPFFYKAAKEALDSGIKLLVAIPEHVPIIDSIKIFQYAEEKGARMIGPNTPGVIVPGIMKVGIMPAQPFTKGQTIVFSRSGTLMYEVSHHLSNSGLGQRLALGIGGDPINGTNLIDSFNLIQNRDDVDSVVVVGEIGGDAEEMLADHIIKTGFTKPVVAYIAGRAAPKEKRMGHAGAIVYGTYGSADSKITNYARADVPVAKSPREVPLLLKTKLRK